MRPRNQMATKVTKAFIGNAYTPCPGSVRVGLVILVYQIRPEVRITLFDQAKRIVALGFVYPVVRRLAACLVSDRRRAILAIPIQQPENLLACEIQLLAA